MIKKKASDFILYVQKQIGKPYWYGTYGQVATESLLKSKRNQYPYFYTADDFESQLGLEVHDCCGLVKAFMMKESADTPPVYSSELDKNVRGLWEMRSRVDSGYMDSFSYKPGALVFMAGNDHVGVYIGHGEVVEAHSHKKGVIKTNLFERNWERWAILPDWFEYDLPSPVFYEASDFSADDFPFNVHGIVGDVSNSKAGWKVQFLQTLLSAAGYKCDVDGEFGNQTMSALKSYQVDHNLEPDGVAGINTFCSILEYNQRNLLGIYR